MNDFIFYFILCVCVGGAGGGGGRAGGREAAERGFSVCFVFYSLPKHLVITLTLEVHGKSHLQKKKTYAPFLKL